MTSMVFIPGAMYNVQALCTAWGTLFITVKMQLYDVREAAYSTPCYPSLL